MPLKAVLGPIHLTFYGVGAIVGAGVYSVIGAGAGLAQEALWLSFVAGAVVASLTALSYAELAAALPVAGAEYVYMRRAFPHAQWLASAVGLAMLAGAVGAAATVAVAFSGYFRDFVDAPAWAAAFALVGACTIFNVWGVREASWANIAFTAIEVGGLLLIIAAGAMYGDLSEPLGHRPGVGVMAGAATLFFVYLGFEQIANFAEEAAKPARDLPVAILVCMGVATLLYVLVSLAVVVLVDPDILAASDAPVAVAIARQWPRLEGVLAAIALFSTANTALITLVSASRLAFSMARDKVLPSAIATVAHTRGTPWVAALVVSALSAALAAVGQIRILAELSSLAALLAFLAVNAALIRLRYVSPELPRPFRVPFNVGRTPVIPVLAIASILYLIVQFELRIFAVLVATVALGVCFAVWRHGWTKTRT